MMEIHIKEADVTLFVAEQVLEIPAYCRKFGCAARARQAAEVPSGKPVPYHRKAIPWCDNMECPHNQQAVQVMEEEDWDEEIDGEGGDDYV